jgi:Rap guanine nucleotide exchange factor 2
VEDGSRHTQVLLRATPDRMISQLVEDTNPADPNFIEDFLLCHRVFLESSLLVVQQLLDWFERPDLRDKGINCAEVCGISRFRKFYLLRYL